jgi:hypothetical protein
MAGLAPDGCDDLWANPWASGRSISPFYFPRNKKNRHAFRSFYRNDNGNDGIRVQKIRHFAGKNDTIMKAFSFSFL